jgi:hypothetical protein
MRDRDSPCQSLGSHDGRQCIHAFTSCAWLPATPLEWRVAGGG